MPTLCPFAVKLAESLTQNNLKLSFKPNTLLSLIGAEYEDMVERAVRLQEADTKEELSISIENYVDSVTPSPFSNPSLEDAYLGNGVEVAKLSVAEDLRPITTSIIDKTRNMFIPLVNEIYEKAFEATTGKIKHGGIGVTIQTDNMEDPIWESAELLGFIDLYDEGVVSESVVKGFSFPDLNEEQLLAIIDQAQGSLLRPIKDHFGDDFVNILTKIYRDRFLAINEWEDPRYSRAYYQLLIALLAKQLQNEIPEGVTGQGDDIGYKGAVGAVFNGALSDINYYITTSKRATDLGRLVLDYPGRDEIYSSDTAIIVNGKIYQEWVEVMGGEVDLIYGAYVSNGERNGEALIKNRESYLREWATYIASARQTQLHQFESTFVAELYSEIDKLAKEHKLKMNVEGVDHLFNRESALTEENAYSFARKAIARILFADEEFLTICNHLDHIFERVENIQLEDAIPLAITDWLVEWAVSQLNLH